MDGFPAPGLLQPLRTIEAFMGETENVDEYRRALAVVTLEAGNLPDKIGLSYKHAQRLRHEFRKRGVEAFKDKRHNNAPVLLTKSQREDVLFMLTTTTPNDHGYTNSHIVYPAGGS